MKSPILLLLLFSAYTAFSQSRTEVFDYSFKPVKAGGYYIVQTEKTDSLYWRKAWFLAQKTLYMEGGYLDEACTIPQGTFKWFHPNRYLKETGHYVNGKKDGAWMRFDEEGRLTDSLNYAMDRKTGTSLSWHKNDYLSDSSTFDGAGNGVEVRWYDDGTPSAAGYWTRDTVKRGRWNYYHRNGMIQATEDYDEDGKLAVCHCYTADAVELDTAYCREQEAEVDIQQWRRFLERGLQPLVEQKAREGIAGSFTVAVRFIVEKDGHVGDVKALTNYGHGIEEGVVALFKKAPVWKPGRYHGMIVRSYHTQPVTFVIASR